MNPMPGGIRFVFQDWPANVGNSKARVVLTAYRLALLLTTSNRFIRIIGLPYCILYRFVFAWIFGIELPLRGVVGSGLRLYHGQGLVVHDEVSIGNDVVLRHCTTIGVKPGHDGRLLIPRIGNNVDVGCNSVILGEVIIGDGVLIGAGSVVTKSVPAFCVVVGNPARIIRTNPSSNLIAGPSLA